MNHPYLLYFRHTLPPIQDTCNLSSKSLQNWTTSHHRPNPTTLMPPTIAYLEPDNGVHTCFLPDPAISPPEPGPVLATYPRSHTPQLSVPWRLPHTFRIRYPAPVSTCTASSPTTLFERPRPSLRSHAPTTLSMEATPTSRSGLPLPFPFLTALRAAQVTSGMKPSLGFGSRP